MLYSNVYIGMALALGREVRAWQKSLCALYGLLPRQELHLTFAFIGAATDVQCRRLARALVPTANADLSSVDVEGIGGGFERESQIVPLDSFAAGALTSCRRVLWLSLRPTPALLAFREETVRQLIRVGFDLPALIAEGSLRSSFWPHVTLGSADPLENKPLWDNHSLAKTPTLCQVSRPLRLKTRTLHVAEAGIHPVSIAGIWPMHGESLLLPKSSQWVLSRLPKSEAGD